MSEANTSLLNLVRGQIEVNLNQINAAVAQHKAAPLNNVALMPCVALAHQVAGALRMVRLPGAARFATEIDSALKYALRTTPADAAEAAVAARGALVLRDFVNDVAAGGAYLPLGLAPVYRELARIGGNAAASEKDLYFPDAHDEAPPHPNPSKITPALLPALIKDWRVRFQRGLLGWLKESAKPDGPMLMRGVMDQMHKVAAQLPEPRSLWWASVRLLDAVIELMPEPRAAEWIARVKPVASRVDFLLRDLAAAGKVDTAPAQRDVFYAVATCPLANAPLIEVRKVLKLDSLMREVLPAAASGPDRTPQIGEARARLENLKEVWTEYAAGEPRRLARFRELADSLAQKARELDNAPLTQLLGAVNDATAGLPDPYPLDGQVMSLEMASALLMAESILQHFHELPADLAGQVDIMKAWLAEAAAGKIATSSPAGLRADIVQKANDEKLRMATAREILKSLQQVEKAVEAFALDPTKRATLTPLIATLRQVEGVFRVSNQKRAARMALACEHLLERCANGSTAEVRHELAWLAEGLGSLGFYLDPCLHGKEPDERAINLYFARYEKEEGFEALLSLSQQISVPKPVTTATPRVVATGPAPQGVDREMLEVFLEEANEVLTAMEPTIAQARANPGDKDSLISVRRAFHTLKGSSRMVGLTAFGECAWELEQVMNHWLAQALPPTPVLLTLADDARTLLAEWAHALQGEAAPAIDDTDITRRARALRSVVPAAETAAPAADIAAPAPVTTATPATPAVELAPPLPPVPAVPGPPTLADTAVPLPIAAPAKEPAAAHTIEQTLAEFDDHLKRLAALTQEIQQEANGAVSSRMKELAHALSTSMREATDLQRRLHALLSDQPKG